MPAIADARSITPTAPIVESLTRPGHDAHVHAERGWGDPGEWQAHCSCGWTGTDFTEAAYIDGSGVIGRQDDAVREMLEHVGFDLLEETSRSDERVTELLAKVSATLAEIDVERDRLRRLARVVTSTPAT